MNYEDRMAFECKWSTAPFVELERKGSKYELAKATWQAACEHKQREVDALKIRIARLEGAGNYLAAKFSKDREDGRVSIDCKNALDKWDSVYQKGKSHTQSLAEVKAETLCEAAADIPRDPDNLTQHAEHWLRARADRILKEAKDDRV